MRHTEVLNFEWSWSRSLAYVPLCLFPAFPWPLNTPALYSLLWFFSANSSWLWLCNHQIFYPRVLSLSFSASKTLLLPKLDRMSSPLWKLLWLLPRDLLAPLTPHSALFIYKGSAAVFSVHFNQWKCETQRLYALSKVTQPDNSRVKNESRSPGYQSRIVSSVFTNPVCCVEWWE